ncbi:MAG: response regulator, partial [Candidatus Zixiibacteriota bacterium]
MKKDLRILLAEDNRYRERLICREISERWPFATVAVVGTAAGTFQGLSDRSVDVAAISLDLPDCNCFELLKQIRRARPHLPVIAVGGTDEKQTASAAIRAGADEFLPATRSLYTVFPDAIERLCALRENLSDDAGQANQQLAEHADLVRITAGTLYHEINNPLMTILGMTELILNDGEPQDDNITGKVRAIRTSAERIRSILMRLSDK